MDCPNSCATQQGAWTNRPLKCGNLRYKWIVLIWWVECCTLAERKCCEILFVTLCSRFLLNHLSLTALPHSTLSPPLAPIPILCPPSYFSHSLGLTSSVPFSLFSARFIFSPARVFRAWNETGSVSAGGCRWCWNLPGFFPQSPPRSHLLLPPVIHNLHSSLKC